MGDALTEPLCLKGQLSDIRYHCPDHGLASLIVVGEEGQPIRAVGKIPVPVIGEILTLEGRYSPHANFGKVFAFDRHTSAPPPDQASQVAYLSALTGIPPSLAQQVMDTFGFQCFDIIEHNPQQLLSIKAIGPELATQMHDRWLAVRGIDKMSDLLTEYGLTKAQLSQLRNVLGLGDGLAEKLRTNPYLLALHLPTVSFRQADSLATRLKADPNQSDRVAAALLQLLRHYAGRGDTLMPVTAVLSDLPRILGQHFPTKHPLITEGLQRLQQLELIRISDDHLFLADIYQAENLLVAALVRIEQGDRHFDTLISPDRLAKLLGQALAEPVGDLIPAVSQVLQHKLSCLTAPMDGQTLLLIKAITHIFSRLKAQVMVVTPSLADKPLFAHAEIPVCSTGELVGRLPDGTARFRHSQPLELDLLIVCRAEAMGVRDLTQVLDALPAAAGVVLIGDPAGHPPHGPGQPLLDLLRAERLASMALPAPATGPHPYLTRSLATEGPVDLRDADDNDTLIHLPLDVALEEAVNLFHQDYLPAVRVPRDRARLHLHAPFNEVQRLNQHCQQRLNVQDAFIRARLGVFHEGDPVFFMRANMEHHIPAGSLGKVVAISPGPRATLLLADGRTVILPSAAMNGITLGYVLPLNPLPRQPASVIMILVPDHSPPPDRALLYELSRQGARLILGGPRTHFQSIGCRVSRTTRLASLLKEDHHAN